MLGCPWGDACYLMVTFHLIACLCVSFGFESSLTFLQEGSFLVCLFDIFVWSVLQKEAYLITKSDMTKKVTSEGRTQSHPESLVWLLFAKWTRWFLERNKEDFSESPDPSSRLRLQPWSWRMRDEYETCLLVERRDVKKYRSTSWEDLIASLSSPSSSVENCFVYLFFSFSCLSLLKHELRNCSFQVHHHLCFCCVKGPLFCIALSSSWLDSREMLPHSSYISFNWLHW